MEIIKRVYNRLIQPPIPTLIFVGIPVLLYGLRSIRPDSSVFVFIAGAILALLFVLFTAIHRPENTPLASTTIPTIFGPILAFLLIQQRELPLDQALSYGGAELVQLAFFFAALITFAGSLWAKIAKKESLTKSEVLLTAVGFGFFLLLFGWVAFSGKGFVQRSTFSTFNTDIWFWITPHEKPSQLDWCRLILTLYTVFLATWPSPSRTRRNRR